MKILFAASEVTPFAKTGGLADVTGSLPKELKRLGHDVRIVLPFYKTVASGNFDLRSHVYTMHVQMGAAVAEGKIHETAVDSIPVYFIENNGFFDRDFLYGTPAGDYPDNPRRFAFFCRAVLDFLRMAGFRPDILHCHDWQTALIPILLAYGDSDPFFSDSTVIYTIHNLAYQGLFGKESLAEMGLDQSYFSVDRLEYYGQVNLMKGAILTADLINTVSETYCAEIQTAGFGCGLDGVLRDRRNDLSGILNGLDYAEWNPATDRDIFCSFTAENLEGKKANKRQLQQLLGLEQTDEIPLLGIVSRLSAQKGLDILARLLHRVAAGRLQLVILGSGDERYVRILSRVAASPARNISINIGFESSLAHKIYAGADIFLMPSHYEPCGLGQLIALRYGTVPVVRKTGGLADTVFDPDECSEPTGFAFDSYTSSMLWQTILRAVRCWHDRNEWRTMVRRGMSLDFSWKQSALTYEDLYRRGIDGKRGRSNG